MTVELYELDAPASAVYFLQWLLPLADSSAQVGLSRGEDDPLPFWLVNILDETDDPDCGTVEGLMSVSIFAPGPGNTAAFRESRRTHRHMLYLARHPLTDVAMPDGSIANLDYLTTSERPRLGQYRTDTVVRYVARYTYGFSFVPAI